MTLSCITHHVYNRSMAYVLTMKKLQNNSDRAIVNNYNPMWLLVGIWMEHVSFQNRYSRTINVFHKALYFNYTYLAHIIVF